MKLFLASFLALGALLSCAPSAHAALTLTTGNNATTTPNVATSITGFQIVGPAASTTPVRLRATSGTLSMTTTTGLTFNGSSSGTSVSFTGTVANINAALATLKYTRASTGTDTLEVSLVESGEVFFEDNGHLYKYISDAGDWNSAKTKAEALTLYGATGYLATITSASENSFVTARLSNAGWMGASDSAVEGAWRWVTGPENGTQFWSGLSGGSTVGGNYANWGTGEPNDAGGEDCAQYLSGGTGKWNDLPCSGTSLPGYVAEFGAPGANPTVVAANISVVTADVPAVTSLSPTNGNTSASVTANLVIGFSKTVSTSTGTITIRKSSDDSIVESIDVSGGLISGGGTSSVTINPSVTLEEGVQYYVLVPNTAFRDGSSNYFAGISDKTTWSFTTADVTAPVITNVDATVATTTASLTWTTNEQSSTKAVYSVGTGYGSATSETDTSSRVTSHTTSLTGLSSCTTYAYKVTSADAAGNRATSTPGSFTTLGCVGAEPRLATTTSVAANATTTTSLTDSGRSISVETPANFTATSSTIVIQIQAQESEPVLTELGLPGSLYSAAAVAFNVTALVNSTTVLDSFDHPVTITYTYTDEDIVGLDERTLTMHHYHDGAWEQLSDCSLDMAANTITCDTPNFSIFAIFGTVPAAASGSSGSRSGGSITSRVKNLTDMGKVAEASALKAEWPRLFPGTVATAASGTPTVRDLETSMEGEDVRMLQKLLNANGFTLATEGLGAPGSETMFFGALTRSALSRFQTTHGVSPSVGYFGPLTRAKMKALGVSGTWW